MERKKLDLCKRLQKYSESLGGIRVQRVIDAEKVANSKRSTSAANIAAKVREDILKAETERAEAKCNAELEIIRQHSCNDMLVRAKNLLRFILDNRVDKLKALNALLRLVQRDAPANGREGHDALCFRIGREIEKHSPQPEKKGTTSFN